MSGHDEIPGGGQPKRVRIPNDVRSALRKAIELHWRQYGRREYGLLRDDPRFAPWIGTSLGETGDKRLDRVIKEMVATRPSLRRTKANQAHRDAGFAEPGPAKPEQQPQTAVISVSPAQVLAGKPSAVLGYNEMVRLFKVSLAQIDNAIASIHDENGEPTDCPLLTKLLKEKRETVETIGRLQSQFTAGLSMAGFHEALFDRLAAEHPDDPARTRALLTDIKNIIDQFGALPATSSEFK